MPFRCCVPNCKGNYDGGPKVSVFKFPEDKTLKKMWLSRIRRDIFTPSASSRVFHVHFQKDDVLWETKVWDERTGQLLTAPLQNPRLKPGAVPLLLPDCPSYFSKEENRREEPEEKRLRLENEHLAAALQSSISAQKDYDEAFGFHSLEELVLRAKEVELPCEWTVTERKTECVYFLKISRNPAPLITHSVVVDTNLDISLLKKNLQLKLLGKRSFPQPVNNIHKIVKTANSF